MQSEQQSYPSYLFSSPTKKNLAFGSKNRDAQPALLEKKSWTNRAAPRAHIAVKIPAAPHLERVRKRRRKINHNLPALAQQIIIKHNAQLFPSRADFFGEPRARVARNPLTRAIRRGLVLSLAAPAPPPRVRNGARAFPVWPRALRTRTSCSHWRRLLLRPRTRPPEIYEPRRT